MDADLFSIWRESGSDREFRREAHAEWVEAQGAYFSDAELAAAVADYELRDAVACAAATGDSPGTAAPSS